MLEMGNRVMQWRSMRNSKAWLRFAVTAGAAALVCAACQPVQAVNSAGDKMRTVAVSAPDAAANETPVAIEAAMPESKPAAQATESAAAAAVENPSGDEAVDSATGIVTDTVTADAAMIEQGLAVYHAQYCGVCHTLAAAGTSGQFGPDHDGIGTTAGARIQEPNYSGSARTAQEYLMESLVKPDAYFVGAYAGSSHRMPPYTHLSDEDLRALVAFLLAQK